MQATRRFAADFEASCSSPGARSEEDVAPSRARHHRRCARARRCGAGRADQQIRPRQCHQRDAESFCRRNRSRARQGDAGTQMAAIETAAARIEAYHRRQIPADERFTDDTGAMLGWRWTSRGQCGALRARRHRRLSLLGADERHSGQGRGREAHRDGDAGQRRQDQSPGAGGGAGAPASARFSASAGPRPWPRWPMAPKASRPWTRSWARAMPRSPRPSAKSSARSASIPSPGPSEILVIADGRNDPGLDRRRSAQPGRT